MDALGVARGNQQPFAIGRIGLGKEHLLAPIGQDRHFGGNHVESVGLQARDQ